MKIVVLNAKNADANYVNDVRQYLKARNHEIHSWHQGIRYNTYDAVILILNEEEDELLNEAQYHREQDVAAPELITLNVGRGLYDAVIDTVKTCFVVVGNDNPGFKFLPVMDWEKFEISNDFTCWGELTFCVHPWMVFNDVNDFKHFKTTNSHLLLSTKPGNKQSFPPEYNNYLLLLLA